MAHDPAIAAAVGARLLKHRTDAGLTRKQFADLLVTSENNVRRWEEGTATPHAVFLVKLAAVMGTDIDKLLDVKPESGEAVAAAEVD